MAEINRISSFKSFTEIKAQSNALKLREENQLKRQELATNFATILDEMGLTSLSELDEDTQRTFISKVLGKDIGEGNAFGAAVKKAKEEGEDEFELDGKTIKVEESLVTEAIQVEGKRDAKKVVTVYNKIFNKILVDFGAMTTESILGCIKYLMSEAMHDANFHREAEPTAKMIKGNIKPLEIKMPGLGGHFVKIGPSTIKQILDKYYSDIANAAGWGGQGIVEGTALYLEQIKQEALGQAALNKFNSTFEGESVRIDLDLKLNEYITEQSVNTVSEGRVKQFEMDLDNMIKDIKRGYGWIDPEYVAQTWDMSSDSIDFEIVKGEVYRQLIKAGLLAYPNDNNEEVAGKQVKSLKELGIKESVVTEAKFVKDFNRDVLKAKTKEEVLELYPNAKFFIGKSDHFFGELDGNLFFKAYYTKAQKEFEIKSVYSEKGSNYVHLYNESVEISEGRYDKGKMARTHVVYAFRIQRKSDNAYQSFRVAVEKGSDAEERAAELLSDYIGKDLKKMTDGSKALNPEFHDIIEESAVTEAKFDKKKLMKAMKADDGIIQLANGEEYIIYAYDNGNDENDAMWNDKSIFALDQDGEEHEVKYSDIVSYNEAEVKSDEEFQEYAFTVLKKAFGEEFDEEKGQKTVDGILAKADGDYGVAVGILTSSLG